MGTESVIQRFMSKVEINRDSECWEWTGTINQPQGVAKFYHRGYGRLAHRLMYEMAFGPIPNKHCVFHSCGNKTCVNPDHLVSSPLKGNNHYAREARCRNGHRYTPQTTAIRTDGSRRCKLCRRASSARKKRIPGAVLLVRQCRHKGCDEWVQVEKVGATSYRQWDSVGVPHKHHEIELMDKGAIS